MVVPKNSSHLTFNFLLLLWCNFLIPIFVFLYIVYKQIDMKFNNKIYENEELTYQDVFLFQDYFEWKSRLDINVIPTNSLGTKIPIVVSNMNSVAGKRMAETIARYGWLVVLPQDMSLDTLERVIKFVKKRRHPIWYTHHSQKKNNTIRDAMWIIYKRDHNCVIMVDDNFKATWIFKPKDFDNLDQFSLLWDIKKPHLITGKVGISNEEAFNIMEENSISSLPIIDDNWTLKWILTKKKHN